MSGDPVNRHLLFLQKPCGKLLAGHAKFLNGREYIECAERFKALQSHLPESMYQIAAALIVCLPHLLHVLIAVLQRLHRRVLTGGRRAHDGILVHFQHLLDDGSRSAGITETPSCHGVGL